MSPRLLGDRVAVNTSGLAGQERAGPRVQHTTNRFEFDRSRPMPNYSRLILH
jgi:hypothetical protein